MPTRPNFEPHYSQTLEFYEQLALLYDFLYPDHLRFSDQLFTQLAPVLRAGGVNRVLDASCGVGHDIQSLLRLGFRVDGVDISQSMLRAAHWRLREAGYEKYDLRLGDVRNLRASVLDAQYDLVVFRGNTFSNIHPSDLSDVVKQLLSVVRSGGLLLVDFRDGKKQLQESKTFELRGWGIDGKRQKTIFCSYYILQHGATLLQPYQVLARVHRLSFDSRYVTDRLTIRSHYVDADQLLRVLSQEAVSQVQIPIVASKGLPYLETLLFRLAK